MSLKLLFKIFAGLQLIQGVMMLFGGSMISEMNGWTHSIGITTMAEHHGAGCICIAILFWMLPKWMPDQQLKEIVPAIIIIQVILAIMPVYHAVVEDDSVAHLERSVGGRAYSGDLTGDIAAQCPGEGTVVGLALS